MYIFNYVPHNAPSWLFPNDHQPTLPPPKIVRKTGESIGEETLNDGSHYQKEAATGTQQSSKTTRTSLPHKKHWALAQHQPRPILKYKHNKLQPQTIHPRTTYYYHTKTKKNINCYTILLHIRFTIPNMGTNK